MKGRAVIGKRLREAREKAGLSQKKLGIAAGIDEFSASSRVNHWEVDLHSPRYSMLEQLGKVLQVPAPYFLARDEDLAEFIKTFGSLSESQKRKLLAAIRKISQETKRSK